MVIGIDASRANRDHKSGTEWYSYYLIRWLAKLDKQNKYILYTYKPLTGGLLDLTTKQHYYDYNKKEEIKYDKKGYQIIKSPFSNFRAKVLAWPFYFFWTQGRLSLEMLIHRPDILFVPAHALPFIHPKKSIVTIHDIGFERDRRFYQSEEMGPEDIRARKILNILIRIFTLGKYKATSIDYLRWSTAYALKRADKIITVSDFSKRELEQFYQADPNKIKVIYNGYNKYLYIKIDDRSKIKKVLNKYDIERPYLLYVGRIEKKKNTPALVEALAILRENNKNIKHKLVLVGDASFGYDEVNYIIREFDLDNEVIMTGWVDEVDLPYFYNGASAFIFPTNYEGFGIPLLQAMACGVPIASSWASSIPEVVGEAALLFDPYNVQLMAQAMERIITDINLREKLIKLSQERIINFSWEKSARETLKEICY